MTPRRVLRAAICATACSMPALAAAQSTGEERLEVSGGVGWFGAATFAEVAATEATPVGGRRTVFSTRSALEASAGVTARVGLRLTSRVSVESALALNSTHLATRVTADVEQVPSVTATESVTEYLIEGGLIARSSRWKFGRAEPFAVAGAGYLRQLNQGQTLVQTGRSYYVGGGTDYLLKQGGTGRIRSGGLRADLRATILEDGVTLDGARHVVPFLGAALFLRF